MYLTPHVTPALMSDLYSQGLSLWADRFSDLAVGEVHIKEAVDAAAALSTRVRQMLADLRVGQKQYHTFFTWLLTGLPFFLLRQS